MGEHKTSKGHPVDHSHTVPPLNAADQEIAKDFLAALFPKAEVVCPATTEYNCHGFAFAPTHLAWYDFADLFIADDYSGTPMDSPEPGDILIYSLEGVLAHSAVVIEVSGSKIVRLQSKWGGVAQVKHTPDHVPPDYGAPIVLLRTQPGVPKHPAAGGGVTTCPEAVGAEGPTGDTEDRGSRGGEAAAGVDAAVSEAETADGGAQPPDRFRLMLASTPEVRRRILRSSTFPQSGGADPFNERSDADLSEAVAEAAAEDVQDEIEKALAELPSRESQFRLMLASTPEVLRGAISRLPPVESLVRIGKADERAKKAVLEFFERPKVQEDEQVTGIALYLLSQLPSKEAVGPLARYLEGKFSQFNGDLAVDALKAAVSKTTT